MLGLRGLGIMAFWLGLAMVPGADVVAQEQVTLSAFGGIGVPVGSFGDESGDDAGLATTGFLLGADVVVPIRSVQGLGWSSLLEGASFGIDDDFVAELTGGLSSELSFDIGRYWMAIVFTGLQYTVPVTPGLDVYGLGQVGAGMMKAPSASIVYLSTAYELESFWEPLTGLSAGAGATVNDRFTLDLRYFHFIDPKLQGELRYLSEVEEISGDQPVSWIQVTAGIRLF